MKRTEAEYRQSKILELINHYGSVHTNSLAKQFRVSLHSIRRDLNELAEKNQVRRNHGGATAASETKKPVFHVEIKCNMAKAIVEHIPDNSTLFIDSVYIADELADFLQEYNELNIITSNISIISKLRHKNNFRLFFLGGNVNQHDHAFVSFSDASYKYDIDYCVFDVDKVDNNGALLVKDGLSLSRKKRAINSSAHSFLVVNHHRPKHTPLMTVGPISQVDIIFSDLESSRRLKPIIQSNNIPTVITE